MKTNENFQLSTFNFQLNKRLAVVILNWNGRALMEEYLPSVVAYTPDEWADVIVADNGSTDDSIEMLKAKFPTVGIIRLDKNYGFAEGYNQALKHIGHEYTVLLNSDVEVTPGWLDAPVAATKQGIFRVCRSGRGIYGPVRLSILPRTCPACRRKRRRTI